MLRLVGGFIVAGLGLTMLTDIWLTSPSVSAWCSR